MPQSENFPRKFKNDRRRCDCTEVAIIDAPAFLPNVEAAPAFGQERRSTDFIVPLGYCRLISNAFFEFEI